MSRTMKTTTLPLRNSMNRLSRQLALLFVPLAIACFALSPQAQATCQEGCLTNDNTVQDDAVISTTSDLNNTTMDFVALNSDTTGSDNSMASWIWRVTGRLNTARLSHTATLLQNGKVLVAAGFGGKPHGGFALADAELYDPASGTWAATGFLNVPRFRHTATLLPDGRVLVAAGFEQDFIFSTTAEVYDHSRGFWAGTGSLNNARADHTATLLHNGMVLVAGGSSINGTLASAELYDPASGRFIATGTMAHARYGQSAVVLNGR